MIEKLHNLKRRKVNLNNLKQAKSDAVQLNGRKKQVFCSSLCF